MEKIQITDKAGIERLRGGSAFTMVGLKADEENLGQLAEWVKHLTAFKSERCYVFEGGLMNRSYGLTGDNAYPETDCTFVCIDLGDLERPMALAIPRFQVGGRWLDDVIDNDLRREAHKRGED